MSKYLKWIVFAIIDVLFNIICYITNPFVLLFADELGNLPRIFLWWSNWDDHLDVDWMISEHHVPKLQNTILISTINIIVNGMLKKPLVNIGDM